MGFLEGGGKTVIRQYAQGQLVLSDGEAFWSQITHKKNFLSPNPWPSRYRLDALTTELWETRGAQGHILGSYIRDKCSANCKAQHVEMINVIFDKWIGDLDKV